LYLLPPSMKDWLGEEHFAWFLLDAMEQMDLSAFHAAYRSDGKGQPAHHPEILLAVLLYGYCHGERPSRQLERLCEEPPPRGRIPKGLTATQRMERKLRTKRGAALYRKRAQTVEPVFGQVKDARGLDRFCRRGDTACDSEWAVMCATHNLLKLYRSRTCAAARQAGGRAKWN
jgi:hypothetical protein